MFLLLIAALILFAVLNAVSRFQQPLVVVLQDPFKLLLKAIVFGVISAVVLVTLITVVLLAVT
ncbi:hypothetical protein KIH74_02745 [Kineosporia sp. J2-2]|uniref:Heme biosynthesis protein HemY n=1 Tax=Kineosporia corallincola TaxID=2835133 RepID=A0ABS5T9U6_9ACTN|nr:hypothetical protein [Kineosporia corallincola]MBT0767823.1 hypothetical protein [Kineosporia corallincola]